MREVQIGNVKVFNVVTEETVIAEAAAPTTVTGLHYTANGRFLIESDDSWKAVRIWDGRHERLLQDIPVEQSFATAIIRYDRYLAAADARGGPIDWVMKSQGVVPACGGAAARRGGGQHARTPIQRSTVPKLAAPVTLTADDQALLLAETIEYYHERLKHSPEALAYLTIGGVAPAVARHACAAAPQRRRPVAPLSPSPSRNH